MDLGLVALLVVLLLLAFIVHQLWLELQKRPQRFHQAWSELARQTGLTFDPGSKASSIFRPGREPQVTGRYRGRFLTLTKDYEYIDTYSGGGVTAVFTRIWVSVANPAGLSLELRDKSILDRVFKKRAVATVEEGLHWPFVATGLPAAFVQRAQALILQRRDILVRRPAGVIKLTDHPFSWTPWRRPSIKMKGPDLVFRMSGVLAVVQTQIALIDLLCDLAELTEEMQRDLSVSTRTPADHTERGG